MPRVGRRGGKSSTLCRAIVAVALYVEHPIPLGDVGVVGIVSVGRDEANQRLRTIRAILTALGVEHTPQDGGIGLLSRPVVFKTFAATLGGVVGGTWIAALFDEVARWKDSDTGVNPATEVLASARPTMATQPHARIFLSSSPLGEFDAHFDAFEEGDTEFQHVCHAPSWVANPTLTEADTHKLERDVRIWSREYAAIPQADVEEGLLAAIEVDEVTREAPRDLPPRSGYSYVAAMDPATRGDVWTLVIATVNAAGRKLVAKTKQWHGSRSAPLSPGATLKDIAATCAEYRVAEVYTDQHAADELAELALQAGLVLIIEPWTAGNKLAALEGLRVRIAAKGWELSPDTDLRTDLLAVRRRITRSGITADFPRQHGRHCDYAPPMAQLSGKYIAPPTYEHELSNEERAQDARRVKAKAQSEQSWWSGKGGGGVSWE